ncbi:MAG: DUF2309 domain-containing protein [Candidatus Omnitrophica bacterium]|nr:DUF2309 domain-containing protein [Candidatus Omnitrophota bacterium]
MKTCAEGLETTLTSPTDECGQLKSILAEIEEIVPPLWPLRDYVAVNPFLGWSHHRFLEAREKLAEVRDCDLLMSSEYYRSQFDGGLVSETAIEEALAQCAREYPQLFKNFEARDLLNWIQSDNSPKPESERRYLTVAEAVDREDESEWSSHILNDISRLLAAHYDEGQALWSSPWKGPSLFRAWIEMASHASRMGRLGIQGFRQFVRELQDDPEVVIRELIEELEVPKEHWKPFLLAQIFSAAGWASYVKQKDFKDLTGLLAVRLAYDVGLFRARGSLPISGLWPSSAMKEIPSAMDDAGKRYVCQLALEISHRGNLRRQLSSLTSTPKSTERKTAQMVFCIDVRSEVMRRHLESVSDKIETFGFAGFFGMALERIPLGATEGIAHCPVLIQPAFRMEETLLDADEECREKAVEARQRGWIGAKVWKSFQTSAISCFSFVESLGWTSIAQLVRDSLSVARGNGAASNGDSSMGPDRSSLPLETQIDLAENLLKNLGLTENFARIVAFCGHSSETVNNPYQAGLDCGACGGHSGEPNARIAAMILNDPRVRSALANRGIRIPEDCLFVSGVHNTTTDEIRYFDRDGIPHSHRADMENLKAWTLDAGRLTRIERGDRMDESSERDLLRRSRDWSETRPEWGLAGNAAFIVAPRERTAGVDLGGRAFLHSYDHRKDPEWKVLELIMTAPMVVANWINLQYYASSVDPRSFGSGNKTIHNVVGQFGIFEGNGGDLMTGLPWQSVHDGQRLQHEPLRLAAIIEAPREAVQSILEKHANVWNLVTHGWMSLTAIDNNRFYVWTTEGEWEESDSDTSAQ